MAGVLTEASSAQDASEPQFAVEAHIDSFKYTSAEKSAAAQTPTLHAPDAVLHDVHLCIKRGSLTVLTGLSGCGKTTLLRLICRLYPDFFEGTLQGSVRVLGRDTHEYAPGEMATCLGLVFQDPRSQFLSTIVEDEIALTGENLGIEREELQKRVEQILAFLGITHLKHRSVLELSGGERQKVAIASVLVSQPDVIVMDEPSASLDYASTLQLAQMLVKLKQAGKTIIVAEHRLFYLTHILDQLVVMQEGTVEGVYEPEQLHQDLAQRLHLRAFDEKTLVAQAATPVTPKLDADVQTKVTAQTAQGTETIPAIGVSREYVRGLDVFVSHHFWKRTQLMQGVGFDLLQG
ncbi:MAG: ABC transporter ATP-binding protein [Atopobium sp.]|uniref:ABC transporter ATP-binding protein n=1 Tax=Atopobium sp. TaxID=1872650 RepID=UPI002A7FF2FF|nr:ABC transporter ATP-binding protein [Atopobium sp.]MDY4523062.1 ABC transporter ATP-binding protein [Atopobium sp.]